MAGSTSSTKSWRDLARETTKIAQTFRFALEPLSSKELFLEKIEEAMLKGVKWAKSNDSVPVTPSPQKKIKCPDTTPKCKETKDDANVPIQKDKELEENKADMEEKSQEGLQACDANAEREMVS